MTKRLAVWPFADERDVIMMPSFLAACSLALVDIILAETF